MAVVRRHWKLFALQLIVIVIIAMVIVGLMHRSGVQAEPPAQEGTSAAAPAVPSIDPVIYSRVQSLRDQCGLGGRELALAGCNKVQAKQVLGNLISWCQNNGQALESAELAEVAARRKLASAMRQINVGPADANTKQLLSQLPALKAEVSAAGSQKQALLEQGVAAAINTLDAAIRARQAQLKANRGLPEPWCLLSGLTPSEMSEIQGTLAKYGTPSTQAKTLYQRLAIGGRLTAIEIANASAAANVQGVFESEREVLPVPQLIRPTANPAK